MNQFDKNIDDVCWRICARLTANDRTADGVLSYIQLHSAMLDFVNFQRDVLRLDGSDETPVYHALCFIDEALLPPLPLQQPPNDWFNVTLHTLMRVLDAANRPLAQGKEYVKHVSRMLDDSYDG